MDDETRKEVLGEALMDELKAIREYVSDIPAIKSTIVQMDGRLGRLETDMGAVKALLRVHDDEIKMNAKEIKAVKARIGII